MLPFRNTLGALLVSGMSALPALGLELQPIDQLSGEDIIRKGLGMAAQDGRLAIQSIYHDYYYEPFLRLYQVNAAGEWNAIGEYAGNRYDIFNGSIALAGERIVWGGTDDYYGNPQIYLGELVNGTLTSANVTKILPPPGVHGEFGAGVALAGNLLVVGAPGGSDSRTLVTDWALSTWTDLIAGPGFVQGFGKAVALEASAPTRLLVASDSGVTFYFDTPSGWAGNDQFFLPDEEPNCLVAKVAMNGVWGAASTTCGSVHLFQYDGEFWSHSERIFRGGAFGASLALQGERLLVGMPDLGSVYDLRLNQGRWTVFDILEQGMALGQSVALSDQVAAAGAPGSYLNSSGEAYLIKSGEGIDFEGGYASGDLDGQEGWDYIPLNQQSHVNDFQVLGGSLEIDVTGLTEYTRAFAAATDVISLQWRVKADDLGARFILGVANAPPANGQNHYSSYRARVDMDQGQFDIKGASWSTDKGSWSAGQWITLRMELNVAQASFSVLQIQAEGGTDTLVNAQALAGSGPVNRILLKANRGTGSVTIDDILWNGQASGLGPNVIVGGDFEDAGDWTLYKNATVEDGKLSHLIYELSDYDGCASATQTHYAFQPGQRVVVEYDVDVVSASDFVPSDFFYMIVGGEPVFLPLEQGHIVLDYTVEDGGSYAQIAWCDLGPVIDNFSIRVSDQGDVDAFEDGYSQGSLEGQQGWSSVALNVQSYPDSFRVTGGRLSVKTKGLTEYIKPLAGGDSLIEVRWNWTSNGAVGGLILGIATQPVGAKNHYSSYLARVDMNNGTFNTKGAVWTIPGYSWTSGQTYAMRLVFDQVQGRYSLYVATSALRIDEVALVEEALVGTAGPAEYLMIKSNQGNEVVDVDAIEIR